MTAHEKEKETQPRPAGIHGEEKGHDQKLKILRKEIVGIRDGHTTGGYCETELLKVKEKELWKLLTKDLEAAKEKYGYSADPKFKHAEIRALELEINGLSYRPELVVKAE